MSHDIKRTGPRDIFLHLLAIITLYFSAIHVGILFFQLIDLYLPDPLKEVVYRAGPTLGPLRWALATLVIVFPVYILLSYRLAREASMSPEKRNLRTRKWLIHFTLFAAGIVIITDLVAVVFNFLQGGLTARFFLKVLAVLVIAGVVFVYYLWNLKQEKMALQHTWMRVFVIVVLVLVTGFVVWGFTLAGSPQSQRVRRFDARRVQDLQSIQSQTLFFWQQKEQLPATLTELEDPISGFRAPGDPQTNQPYEYRVLSDLSFELCAIFGAAGGKDERFPERIPLEFAPELPQNWEHGIGRTCFERTIDPELYARDKAFAPRPAL